MYIYKHIFVLEELVGFILLLILPLSYLSVVASDSLGIAPSDVSDAYDSGYDYGCEDALTSDRYVNQTLEAPSSQAETFRNGYHDGLLACSRDLDTGNIDPGASVLANDTELKEIDPGINRTGEPDIGIDSGINLLKPGIDIENIDPGLSKGHR
jgi:hypothetical protein